MHTGLRSNALKDIIDEAVHDVHRFVADPSVGVHLLQHLEDVQGEVPDLGPPLALLALLRLRLGHLGRLPLSTALAANLGSLGWHAVKRNAKFIKILLQRYNPMAS